jgi:hypothetical protein
MAVLLARRSDYQIGAPCWQAVLPLATVNQQLHCLALELLVVSFLNLLFLHGFSLFTLSFRVRKIRGGSNSSFTGLLAFLGLTFMPSRSPPVNRRGKLTH